MILMSSFFKMPAMTCSFSFIRIGLAGVLFGAALSSGASLGAAEKTMRVELGGGVSLELVGIPAGEFMMGSSPAEKAWATGIEGGAQPGTSRESFEGEEPRRVRVKEAFWMGRTEVSVGQFRHFVEESGYVSDAEKPGGETQVFNPEWDGYHLTTKAVHPWISMAGKSWRDPNWGFPNRDVYPVVCVSYNDMRAFCEWLTAKESKAGKLPAGLEYRLPTEAEWEYACRGGSKEALAFWWGNEIEAGQGRLNISSIDLLPGRDRTWPLAKVPWSDGFAFVSPVDHYGERGRNGFGLADMCGGVWEFVLDHFDAKGGHEELYFDNAEQRTVSRPVCKGGNYFDVPGNARCAVRLGIRNVTYSDSRDGFRVCLGSPRSVKPEGVKP
jgi:formylglycine-generating enzyme required for sulfatase activity